MPASEAAAKMQLPDGFRATVFAAEPDVRQPIGMALDARRRLWVAECYTYAEASAGYALQLRDRLVIFEDTDGDGRFDKRTVFTDNLQRLTSVELGFGGVGVTAPPHIYQLIAQWKERLTPAMLANADQHKGRALFTQVCATCHRLYGEGATIGPDLTGSGRASLDYLLQNLADPSAVVPRDYQLSLLTMKDRRVLSGLIRSRNERIVVLQTLTETLNLQTSDVAKSETSPASLMPDGLLGAFDETQTRDLIGYLMSKEPLPPESK